MQNSVFRSVQIFVTLFIIIGYTSIGGYTHDLHAVSSVTLFSDGFDQAGNTLTNKWRKASITGASNPNPDARESITDNGWNSVGVSDKALLLEGESSANPDAGVEHDIATQGYASLTIQYSRAINSFDLADNDQFVAEYTLDDGAAVVLETLTADQVHSLSPEFLISNPERYTKLTLRFYIARGTSDNDEVGIDDVVVKANDAALFYDGFESDDFSNWTSTEETSVIVTNDARTWTDANTAATGRAADIGGSATVVNNPDDAIVKLFDSTGYKDIKLRYARNAAGLETTDRFRTYYSTTAVPAWTEFENVVGGIYQSVTFSLPTSADNNSNLRFRFETNANSNTNDDVYLDDVVIWGTLTPPTVIVKKTVINDNGGTKAPGDFTMNVAATNPSQVSFAGDAAGIDVTMDAGVFTITETNDGTYTLVASGSCDGTIAFGETKTCELINDDIPGRLTVTKQIVGSDDPASNFTITVDDNASPASFEGNSDGGTLVTVNAGAYAVTENPLPSDYTVTYSTDCTGTIALNENKICTITNTKKGKIIIQKETLPDDSEQEFQFTASYNAEGFSLSNEESNDSDWLEPGVYNVAENAIEGWDITSATCSNGSPLESISLAIGETVTCTVINRQRGNITITKQTEPDQGNTFTFNMAGGESNPYTGSESVVDDGSALFNNLVPGTYTVSEVIPEGWTGTQKLVCNAGPVYDLATSVEISVDPGQTVACNINNTEYGIISGIKFEDTNSNSSKDISESSIAGWTIHAYKADSSEVTAETETNVGGYSLTNLEAMNDLFNGVYNICEVQKSGWIQTYPTAQTVGAIGCTGDGEAAIGYQIEVFPTGNIGGKNFGNFKKGSISGAKFSDRNGTGEWDKGESGLSGWTINLTDTSDSVLDTSTTNKDGSYSFSGLAYGTYRVHEVIPGDPTQWLQTLPQEPKYYELTITSGTDFTDKNFGNKAPNISGTKYNDLNRNGSRDEGEPGLADWTIRLSDGESTRENVTDESGSYSFFEVPLGTYTLTEVAQRGWEVVEPASGSWPVIIDEAGEDKIFNFGNFTSGSVSGLKYNDANGNGTRDEEESGLSEWTIYADANENSMLDEGEVSAITNAEGGTYTLAGLNAGSYKIREVAQEDWTQTQPGDSGSYSVTVTSGSNITGKDFGNRVPPTPTPTPTPTPEPTPSNSGGGSGAPGYDPNAPGGTGSTNIGGEVLGATTPANGGGSTPTPTPTPTQTPTPTSAIIPRTNSNSSTGGNNSNSDSGINVAGGFVTETPLPDSDSGVESPTPSATPVSALGADVSGTTGGIGGFLASLWKLSLLLLIALSMYFVMRHKEKGQSQS